MPIHTAENENLVPYSRIQITSFGLHEIGRKELGRPFWSNNLGRIGGGRMDLGRNQYVVSLELGIFQGRPKSIRPNSETVKIRPMAQEADSTHFFRPISVHPLAFSAVTAKMLDFDLFEKVCIFVVWLGRFAPAFRALGVCEHS